MRFIPIIGLEIHAQLKTQSKMFCACRNVDDGVPPNTAICPVCTGQPGALPALNEQALELGILAGLALNCRIPDHSAFDRKNYFYPDLPKGYQISQFHLPIALNGWTEIDVPGGQAPRDRIRVGITRAHLEEDAAKNFHSPQGTLVDYNRSGTPLLEIVTEPNLRSPEEAKYFLQELRAILRAVHASEADMEKGQMRCDANISLLEVGEDNLPTQSFLNPKVEIKNLNSFRAVERALAYEIKRQAAIYEANKKPEASTRGWDENKGETFEQRSKETSADYRYFPEPDLPPQNLASLRQRLQSRQIELPAKTRARLEEEWGFSKSDVVFLVVNDSWADFAERVMGELGAWLESVGLNEDKKKLAKLAGGWLTSKLAGLLADKKLTLPEIKITPEDFAEFLVLLHTGKIGSANAQKLLALMVETGTDPSVIMEEHDLGQSMDEAALSEIVKRVIEQNPDQVAAIRAGKIAAIKWFVGGVMKATEGKANPSQAEELIKKQIGV
jgi:aspartyl-tRNA(Asn)/glutamyl-tRNA(Gln) amidotransferase subunit B